MKVGLSRKFQLPPERFESHEVSVEFTPADWGYLDEDVAKDTKYIRLELLYRCHQVVLIDMVAEGRLDGKDAKKRLETIRQILHRQRDVEQTGDEDMAADMDTTAAELTAALDGVSAGSGALKSGNGHDGAGSTRLAG